MGLCDKELWLASLLLLPRWALPGSSLIARFPGSKPPPSRRLS